SSSVADARYEKDTPLISIDHTPESAVVIVTVSSCGVPGVRRPTATNAGLVSRENITVPHSTTLSGNPASSISWTLPYVAYRVGCIALETCAHNNASENPAIETVAAVRWRVMGMMVASLGSGIMAP